MECLKIGTALDVDVLREHLNNSFTIVEEEHAGNFTFFQCEPVESDSWQSLSDLIIDRLEHLWLTRMLRTHYGYFDLDEQSEILSLTESELETKRTSFQEHVSDLLAEQLRSNPTFVIEGFVRFRLKEYWKALRDALDQGIDAYLMEREYREFIKLLRYFVELQEPKVEFVNVITPQEGVFRLLDEYGDVIRTEHLEGFILEIGYNELDFEDLLISALITVAPRKIMLHMVDENSHMSKTIVNIFEDRVQLCPGCSMCYQVDQETNGTYRKGK